MRRGVIAMLMMKERRPAFRTIEGWARSVLLDAGAIRECEEHGWMSDYLRSQVALAYAARASRAFALSLTSSLRASAMRITIFSFPLARNLSRNAPRLWPVATGQSAQSLSS